VSEFRDKLKQVEGHHAWPSSPGRGSSTAISLTSLQPVRKVWDRLLSGLVFDALEAKESSEHAETCDIDQLLKTTNDAAWKPTEPIGEGEEFRAELGNGEQASALTFEDSLVHGSVLVGR
jgi:hypothetical protein